MASLITLTTDFGTRDPYVAQMKGVLATLCREAPVLDLTHEIAAHDVLEGALFLVAAVPTFPPGTVHLAVVDPGVGSARRAIAAAVEGQYVVCPDNGLLTLLAREHLIEAVRELTNPALRREPVSATFHGRDIFAPAAAHLACGGAFEKLGAEVRDLATLELSAPQSRDDGIHGEVIHVDRFGNAITNIPASLFDVGAARRALVAGRALLLSETYAAVEVGAALALIGSAGYLEIAAREASAAHLLGLGRGDAVIVEPA